MLYVNRSIYKHSHASATFATPRAPECHHKSNNNNLNIYEVAEVDSNPSFEMLRAEINFLFSNDPQDCKWLREYARRQHPRKEIHFSIKRMFKLEFKFNLCMLIHFPFCFASFMTKRDFLRVHQMPLKALILHSFWFPLKASMFLWVSTPEGKNRKQTLYYDDFLLRWLFGVLFAFGCERRFEKVFFVLFASFFTAKTREEAVPCFNLTPF